MDGVREATANLSLADGAAGGAAAQSGSGSAGGRRNRIQVSSSKRPLYFYVNLAKRLLQQFEDVELSALGLSIATAVTVAEILKNNGFAVEKRVACSTMDLRADDRGGRAPFKPKLEVVLGKSEHFEQLMAAAAEEALVAPPETS
ncbi:unnamed protein product [Closterium sp. Naga37s-1]|nr:unnamed protein product [Closterium sp. Naga37s-1]